MNKNINTISLEIFEKQISLFDIKKKFQNHIFFNKLFFKQILVFKIFEKSHCIANPKYF